MESTNKRKKANEYAMRYYYRSKTEPYINHPNSLDPYEVFEWNGRPITLRQLAIKGKCSLREMYRRCNTYKTIEECIAGVEK